MKNKRKRFFMIKLFDKILTKDYCFSYDTIQIFLVVY